MGFSLGYALYSYARRGVVAIPPERPVRPVGRLVWLCAPRAGLVPALADLAGRIADEDGHLVLMTCPDPVAPRTTVLADAPPDDTAQALRAFLDHWRPDLVVLADGELPPALIRVCDERRIPVMMVAARAPTLPRGVRGWFPGLLRDLSRRVSPILALDAAAARAFRKEGADLNAVEVTGKLEEESRALPCHEGERAALAQMLATRPVWLAADIPEAEEAMVIAAHSAALAMAHRLLLILVPQDPSRADALARRMAEDEGWIVAQRSRDEEPDAETQVYLVEGGPEYGLWYRLAPITYLGHSLAGQGCARDPMEPAALGSAILYGPRPGAFGTSFGRLGSARAARAVATASDLAESLADLLAPDRAALLANAAWAVVSDGAEATDRALAHMRRILDGE